MCFAMCKITYVFLQRFFTTSFYICKFACGMCFYNVFLHMVCIFTTFLYIPYVFLQRFLLARELRSSPANIYICIFTYVFLQRSFHLCIFTCVFLQRSFYLSKEVHVTNEDLNI